MEVVNEVPPLMSVVTEIHERVEIGVAGRLPLGGQIYEIEFVTIYVAAPLLTELFGRKITDIVLT